MTTPQPKPPIAERRAIAGAAEMPPREHHVCGDDPKHQHQLSDGADGGLSSHRHGWYNGASGGHMRQVTLASLLSPELGITLVKERTTINDFVVERVERLIEN
jgi:hypothetical protein